MLFYTRDGLSPETGLAAKFKALCKKYYGKYHAFGFI
jgi:hypothetical protein